MACRRQPSKQSAAVWDYRDWHGVWGVSIEHREGVLIQPEVRKGFLDLKYKER